MAEAEIIEKTIDRTFKTSFAYKDLSKVMRIIRESRATIESQQMETDCVVRVTIRKNDVAKFLGAFDPVYEVVVSEDV